MSESRSTSTSAQQRATDPAASAWVSANAGTGKTYVLVRRVLRLLLAGSPPERLLCLTFTKAAAAEMSSRLFALLARWVTADDNRIATELRDLLGRNATSDEREAARTLFARAIETPGGLKVQTIHAFCERILQRFPLEAGITPGFRVIEEHQQSALLRESVDHVLGRAASEGGRLAEALQAVIAHSAETGIDGLLGHMVSERQRLAELVLRAVHRDDPIEEIGERLRQLLRVPVHATPETVLAEQAEVLADPVVRRLQAALAEGSASDIKAMERTAAVLAAHTHEIRAAGLRRLLLTSTGQARARLMTQAVAEANPALADAVSLASDRFLALEHQRVGLEAAEATAALLRIADVVIARYTLGKARAAVLDYDDLIARTAGLLTSGSDTQWVLYKLDGGLDHILLDEAQDTSPEAWQVVSSLAEEFFVGAGSRDGVRTMFAVGDEKQSIYGFQGAAPEMFAAKGRELSRMAVAASLAYHRVPLTLSFRSTRPVLAAVDRVFAGPAVAGLLAEEAAIEHALHRVGHAGLVEIWPTERAEKPADEEPWTPYAVSGQRAAMEVVASRIAGTIAGWLREGEPLLAEGRNVTAGDILILVRKRNPFAPTMIRALKSQGIPVSGTDRLLVMDQIGVKDLVALCQVLLLPEDDLSLAAVLKSPLIGLDDDDLLAIGNGRRGSLWSALLAAADRSLWLAAAAAQLKRWRNEADFLPPFELLQRVLAEGDRRARMLERLGPEAGDAIDELLDLALRYDSGSPPSLQGFLDWLAGANPAVKRDMDQGRDEVRVMTVHGAKGLEAPVVFLPDTCSQRAPRGVGVLDPGQGEPPVWLVKGASGLPALAEARRVKAEAERHEHHRLLYVALTRARDRLYVTGYESHTGRQQGCWYDLVHDALRDHCAPARLPDGTHVLRLEEHQTAPPRRHEAVPKAAPPSALPGWALRPAAKVISRVVPLAPSRLAPLESEEGNGFASPAEAAPSPRVPGLGNRFLRGTLTHALLQHLPEVAPLRRREVGAHYLGQRLAGLPPAAAGSILEEVLAILEHPEHAALFGPGSLAEVPIAAEVPLAVGEASIRIAGQIDRLLVEGSRVRILDYKTNRPSPRSLAEVPEAYLLQLAAYRVAVARIYATARVEAGILWTDGARLMMVPQDVLADHEKSILAGRPWS